MGKQFNVLEFPIRIVASAQPDIVLACRNVGAKHNPLNQNAIQDPIESFPKFAAHGLLTEDHIANYAGQF